MQLESDAKRYWCASGDDFSLNVISILECVEYHEILNIDVNELL